MRRSIYISSLASAVAATLLMPAQRVSAQTANPIPWEMKFGFFSPTAIPPQDVYLRFDGTAFQQFVCPLLDSGHYGHTGRRSGFEPKNYGEMALELLKSSFDKLAHTQEFIDNPARPVIEKTCEANNLSVRKINAAADPALSRKVTETQDTADKICGNVDEPSDLPVLPRQRRKQTPSLPSDPKREKHTNAECNTAVLANQNAIDSYKLAKKARDADIMVMWDKNLASVAEGSVVFAVGSNGLKITVGGTSDEAPQTPVPEPAAMPKTVVEPG